MGKASELTDSTDGQASEASPLTRYAKMPIFKSYHASA